MPLLVVALHLMVTRTTAPMVTVISLAVIGTGDRIIAKIMDTAVMAMIHSAVMMVGGITVMMGAVTVVMISAVMMEGGTVGMTVVLPRVAVVVVVPPPPTLTPSARSARNMATLRISAGGATLTVTVMMMMTLSLVRRAPMGLTPTGTWTAVLLII
jgi:hypothetical protein